MRDILGHKSRDQGEIIDILIRSGTYTCPTLPHYRYDRVKEVCRRLERHGLLKKSGRNSQSVNLVVTPLFREWQAARDAGRTLLGALRWAKQQRNPGTISAAIASAAEQCGKQGEPT